MSKVERLAYAAALTSPFPVAAITGAARRRPVFNVVISNVPGPRKKLYSNSAEMLTHYPVSVPAHGQGLNIKVQSYAGTLFYGLTACRQALPDADRLRDLLHEALEALLAGCPVVTGGAPTVATPEGASIAQRAA